MAQISEEHIVIKVSQLIRDDEAAERRLNNDVASSLEAVVAELVGEGCVVEVVAAE